MLCCVVLCCVVLCCVVLCCVVLFCVRIFLYYVKQGRSCSLIYTHLTGFITFSFTIIALVKIKYNCAIVQCNLYNTFYRRIEVNVKVTPQNIDARSTLNIISKYKDIT